MSLAAPKGLYVRRLELGPMQNFVYLVGPADRPETAVIDPAWDVDAILSAAGEDGRRLTHALVSHRHHDHVNGLAPLLERLDLRVVVHRDDAPALHRDLPPSALTCVTGGERIEVGGLPIACIHTPGHTPGSQCFHAEPGEGAVWSGDTVFVDACGRCDFEGGDPAKMHDSLTRVLGGLDGATRLYPGHDYGEVKDSTLARERAHNPYFRFDDAAGFIAHRMRPRR